MGGEAVNQRFQTDPEWSTQYVIRFLVWGGALILIVLCCIPEDSPARRLDAPFLLRLSAAFWSCMVGCGITVWIALRYRKHNLMGEDAELLNGILWGCALVAFMFPNQACLGLAYLLLVGMGYVLVFVVRALYTVARILWPSTGRFRFGLSSRGSASPRRLRRGLTAAVRAHEQRMAIFDQAPIDDEFFDELTDMEAQRMRREVRSVAFDEGGGGTPR
jgi:hypothetical protein